jgi:hypothetical protein
MNISLFENATFLELVSEFNEYELVIKREKELYSIKVVINNIEYNSSNNNLDECIRDLIIEILESKAQEKSIMIEELINEWKTLEEIIEEVKEI